MNGTYFARPILSADNELRQKNVAIDPQASDCIAAAAHRTAMIHDSFNVWNEVEDLTEGCESSSEAVKRQLIQTLLLLVLARIEFPFVFSIN
jgi:hypothetical protein